MSWAPNMDPFGNLGLSALVAAVPILFLFCALAIQKMKGHTAAVLTIVLAVLVAILGYGMPTGLALSSTAYGALFGLFPVGWIVITAVFLCNMTVKTGQFEIIKGSNPALFARDPVWGPRAEALAARVREFSSFILEYGGVLPRAVPEAVTYHDACHLRRVLGVSEEPRRVLARAGKEVQETPGRPRCCGFGGEYTVKFPDLSRALLRTKIQALDQVRANTIVTDCPGCLLQLRGGLAGDARRRRVYHTAEVLAEGLLSVSKGSGT